ncbi:MAG: hypothetical protein ABIH21_04390 [Patescibacteria group bacterium]
MISKDKTALVKAIPRQTSGTRKVVVPNVIEIRGKQVALFLDLVALFLEKGKRPLGVFECQKVVNKYYTTKNPAVVLNVLSHKGLLRSANEAARTNLSRIPVIDGVIVKAQGKQIWPKAIDADKSVFVFPAGTETVELLPAVLSFYQTLVREAPRFNNGLFAPSDIAQIFVGTTTYSTYVSALEKADCLRVVSGKKKSRTDPCMRHLVYRPCRSTQSKNVYVPEVIRACSLVPSVPEQSDLLVNVVEKTATVQVPVVSPQPVKDDSLDALQRRLEEQKKALAEKERALAQVRECDQRISAFEAKMQEVLAQVNSLQEKLDHEKELRVQLLQKAESN